MRTTHLLTLALAALLVALTGCPSGGTITDSYVAQGPGDVDMLWIIDNSGSMADAQGQLAQNFSAFVEVLPEDSTTQMGITTTQAWVCTEDAPALCDDTVGTAGRVRHNLGSPAYMDPSDADDQLLFEQLAHVGIYGAGFERPLQAALMAVCEAIELPGVSDFDPDSDDLQEDFPSGCSGSDWDTSHPYYEACHCLPLEIEQLGDPPEFAQLHGANNGLLRSDNPLHIVIVTDEGDDTSELEDFGGAECGDTSGDDLCDCRLEHYLPLLESVIPAFQVSVIGPGQGPDADEDVRYHCNPMSSDACGIDFYFNSVEWTNGTFSPIATPIGDSAECEEAELAPAMADLVLHHPAIEWFRLSSVPKVDSIVVTMDDDQMPSYDDGGSCVEGGVTSGGWTYDGDRRAVSIVGDCTAFSGSIVKISYESAGPLLVM